MSDKATCSDNFVSLINTINGEIMKSLPRSIAAQLDGVKVECRVAESSNSAGIAYVQENRIVIHEYGFGQHPRPKSVADTLCHELSHIYNYKEFDGKFFYNESGRKRYYYGHGSPTFKEFLNTCYNGWEEYRDANIDISKGIE